MYKENIGFGVEHARISEITRYKAYNLKNFREISQLRSKLTDAELFELEVAGSVFPFKSNNYVVERLIDWSKVPNDPIYKLTFPQKEMLPSKFFDKIATAIKNNAPTEKLRKLITAAHLSMNPHPGGQMEHNVPKLNGERLNGVQHKYHETVLFFPKQGQTCHAYCTFCFRWPQFIGNEKLKFASKEIEPLIEYIRQHKEITDVLFTGGDPMIMKGSMIYDYLSAVVDAHLPNIRTIRIGSKALSYWPQRFTSDPDSDIVLRAFEKVVKSGKHLAFMAHFNHYQELDTDEAHKAIKRIRATGAEIRTQSPIFRHINDSPDVWAKMWAEQVRLGCVPYYMFMARDTGANHYFSVPLVEAYEIYRKAYSMVSGIARTVRGPVMSCTPGKVQMLGVNYDSSEDVMVLGFIQGRKPDWVQRPFFAEMNKNATWVDELKPAFGKNKFFFEEDFSGLFALRETARFS